MIEPKAIARRWFRREDFRSDVHASLRMVGQPIPPLDAYDKLLQFAFVEMAVSTHRIRRELIRSFRLRKWLR